MIDASTFLRRALLADAIFSGVAALGFTFGAGAFATLFNLPEARAERTKVKAHTEAKAKKAGAKGAKKKLNGHAVGKANGSARA